MNDAHCRRRAIGVALSSIAFTAHGAMVGLLALGLAIAPPRRTRSRTTAKAAKDRVASPSATWPGFTLVEMLVVIAVLAVFLGLLLPALHRFRDYSRTSQSLSNLRQHSAVFAAYSIDWRDRAPYFTDPASERTTIPVASRQTSLEIGYFLAFAYWNYALADGYYNGDPFASSFYPPKYPDGWPQYSGAFGPTPYYYACSFLASPDYWDLRTRTGREQWRATSLSDPPFPSRKFLLVSMYPMHVSLPATISRSGIAAVVTEVAAVDGSADRVKLGDIHAGVADGEGPAVQMQAGIHQTEWPYGLHTLRGVEGRDR